MIVARCLGQLAVVQEMVGLVRREGIEAHKTMYKHEKIRKLWQQQALGRRETLPYTIACMVKPRLGSRWHLTSKREEEEEEEEMGGFFSYPSWAA